MAKVELTDEDAAHIREWQRLSPDAKEGLNKLAKLLGDEGKRKSLYQLIETHSEIASLVAIHAHLSFMGRIILMVGGLSAAIVSSIAVWKVFIGK